jgi:hypothetical protein
MEKFTSYAKITETQKQELIKQYRYARRMGSDVGHAVTCAAHNALCNYSSRAWQSQKGTNSFAAAMATLMIAGEIKLVDAKVA